MRGSVSSSPNARRISSVNACSHGLAGRLAWRKEHRSQRPATGRWLQHTSLVYGFCGDGTLCGWFGAGGACGAGAAGIDNIGGTVGTALGGGVDVVIGFSKRSCCIASPAQKLVRNWVRMVSQMRRASSFRFFAFRMYTCESMASGAA